MILEKHGGDYYHCRIPVLTRSRNNTLIACYECRKTDSDWSEIDLKIIISEDDGEAWQTSEVITGNGSTLNNPVLIASEDTVHFVFCKNYRQMFHSVSHDNGHTWSVAQEITYAADAIRHTVVATGPCHGVISSEGVFVIPVWFAFNESDEYSHHPSFISTIYSKDKGQTWAVGEVIKTENIIDPSEAACALLSDGSIILSIRNENDCRNRYFAKSASGYDNWKIIGHDERFSDPVCQGSMTSDNGVIYHLNCNSKNKRENLTLKYSCDDLKSVKSITVDSCGGYSDIFVKDNIAYIIYEDTTDNEYEYYVDIKFTKIVIS